jgi:hypothetical protein
MVNDVTALMSHALMCVFQTQPTHPSHGYGTSQAASHLLLVGPVSAIEPCIQLSIHASVHPAMLRSRYMRCAAPIMACAWQCGCSPVVHVVRCRPCIHLMTIVHVVVLSWLISVASLRLQGCTRGATRTKPVSGCWCISTWKSCCQELQRAMCGSRRSTNLL